MIGDNVTHSRSGDFGELETLLKNEFGRVQGVFVSLCSEIAFQPLIDIYNHKPKERSTDQTTEMKKTDDPHYSAFQWTKVSFSAHMKIYL